MCTIAAAKAEAVLSRFVLFLQKTRRHFVRLARNLIKFFAVTTAVSSTAVMDHFSNQLFFLAYLSQQCQLPVIVTTRKLTAQLVASTTFGNCHCANLWLPPPPLLIVSQHINSSQCRCCYFCCCWSDLLLNHLDCWRCSMLTFDTKLSHYYTISLGTICPELVVIHRNHRTLTASLVLTGQCRFLVAVSQFLVSILSPFLRKGNHCSFETYTHSFLLPALILSGNVQWSAPWLLISWRGWKVCKMCLLCSLCVCFIVSVCHRRYTSSFSSSAYLTHIPHFAS